MRRKVVPPAEDALAPSTDSLGNYPLDADLGWALRIVSMSFQAWADGAVAQLPSGARGYLVLVAVAQGHRRSQLALGQSLNIDKTAMTHLIDVLESSGLVTRTPDPADRRARHITITPSGMTALALARRRLVVSEQRLLSALSPDEAEQLHVLLARVARAAQTSVEDCDAS